MFQQWLVFRYLLILSAVIKTRATLTLTVSSPDVTVGSSTNLHWALTGTDTSLAQFDLSLVDESSSTPSSLPSVSTDGQTGGDVSVSLPSPGKFVVQALTGGTVIATSNELTGLASSQTNTTTTTSSSSSFTHSTTKTTATTKSSSSDTSSSTTTSSNGDNTSSASSSSTSSASNSTSASLVSSETSPAASLTTFTSTSGGTTFFITSQVSQTDSNTLPSSSSSSSDGSSSNTTNTDSSTALASKSHVGAIIGGVIAAIVVVIAVAFWLVHKRNSRRNRDSHLFYGERMVRPRSTPLDADEQAYIGTDEHVDEKYHDGYVAEAY